MTISRFEHIKATQPAFVLYFYNDQCDVCKVLLPKVKDLLYKKFPLCKLYLLNAQIDRVLAGQLRILTVPGIVIFFQGSEFIRSSGVVSLLELEKKIQRPYLMLFG